jgi:hypothetical protein
VRERRKRPNVNEGAMVKWALLSIRPRGRVFAALGRHCNWRLMFTWGRSRATPAGTRASSGQGCFETSALIGCTCVSDVGLQCFERLSPPSESFIFGAQVDVPRIYWGSPAIRSDWHERPPIMLSSLYTAVTCGTSPPNDDCCLSLESPVARAGVRGCISWRPTASKGQLEAQPHGV